MQETIDNLANLRYHKHRDPFLTKGVYVMGLFQLFSKKEKVSDKKAPAKPSTNTPVKTDSPVARPAAEPQPPKPAPAKRPIPEPIDLSKEPPYVTEIELDPAEAEALFREGMEYYKQQESGMDALWNAGDKWEQAARGGHVKAQFYFALLQCRTQAYAKLYTVGERIETAIHWFTMAARQGHVEAQYLLGAAYSFIDDDEAALKWCCTAAAHGHALANAAVQNYQKGKRLYKLKNFFV